MASLPSQPFAGVGVADRDGEQSEVQRQHEDIKHGNAPVHRTHQLHDGSLAFLDRTGDTGRVGFRGGARAKNYMNLISERADIGSTMGTYDIPISRKRSSSRFQMPI